MPPKRSSIRELVPEGYKLLEVEALRWRAIQRRKQIHEALWIPLFKQGVPIEKWWGMKDNDKIIFTCLKEGISSNHVSSPQSSENILTLPDIDLPLIMNDIQQGTGAYQTLTDRMAGVQSQLPLRQDLVDMYFKCNRHSSKIGRLIGKYNDLIKRYISYRFHEDHPREAHFERNNLINLTLNGRIYTCLPGRDIMICPEDTRYEYNEQHVLIDEAAKPFTHGYKRYRMVEPPTKPKRKPKAIA